jgi:two-component system response regulator NreC
MTPKIRVLIVDDHAIVRQGIRLILTGQADLEVVAEAEDGGDALRLIEQQRPDVVLMDLAMPGINGLQATREIGKRWPDIRVIALTVHDDEEYLFEMITAGASGYVLKGADPADLVDAIRAVRKGEIFLQPPLTTKLVRDYLRRMRTGEAGDGYDSLSVREHQVLSLIGEGHTAQEIAGILTISVSTVQTHRAHIMEKLNLRSRPVLMKYAIRHGLLPSPGQ